MIGPHAMKRAREFARQAQRAGLPTLVVGARAYTSLGVFCFDKRDAGPRIAKAAYCSSVLEALQMATLWQIETERAKYLTKGT